MAPITLYTAGTPNGFKASVTLEELGIDYETRAIDLSSGEQKQDWYLKINPNGRIPALGPFLPPLESHAVLVDHENDDLAVFESGAMMIYLAERYGDGSLLPKEGKERYEVLAWVMFQMGGVGPMMGQFNFFTYYASEKIPFAQKRYYNESKRLFSVLEKQLSDGREYLTGNYTLADIANFCWVGLYPLVGIDLDDNYPNLKAWFKRIYARDAIKKGFDVPKEFMFKELFEDEEKVKAKIKETLEKAEGVLDP